MRILLNNKHHHLLLARRERRRPKTLLPNSARLSSSGFSCQRLPPAQHHFRQRPPMPLLPPDPLVLLAERLEAHLLERRSTPFRLPQVRVCASVSNGGSGRPA